MPFGDELHKEIVSGALALVQAIYTDTRLQNVHISIDIAGSNEFGSYVVIKFAKPNSADPLSWALVDFKESHKAESRISTMLMLRRKGMAQADSRMLNLQNMAAIQAHLDDVLEFMGQ